MLAGRGVSMRVKMYIYGIFGLGVLFVPRVHLPPLLLLTKILIFRASVANFIRLASLVKLKASTDQLCKFLPLYYSLSFNSHLPPPPSLIPNFSLLLTNISTLQSTRPPSSCGQQSKSPSAFPSPESSNSAP